MSMSCLFIFAALWLSTRKVPLLLHPFPHMLCLPHFGPDEGCATLLRIRRKEARIAEEVVSIFQLLKFFPSICPILCAWLILPLWSGFGLGRPLKHILIMFWIERLQYTDVIKYPSFPEELFQDQNHHLHQLLKLRGTFNNVLFVSCFVCCLLLFVNFFQLVFCFTWLSSLLIVGN